MIPRRQYTEIAGLLEQVPAVALVGPRQCGKTTLAMKLARSRPSVYLDLESPSDRARLQEPELFLNDRRDELIVLDEIQRLPEIFRVLRGDIDRGRREGRRTGRFLLLGSASLELLKQSGESLAGRLAIVELTPFDALEIGPDVLPLWLRGGFPDSLLAPSEAASLRWRQDFIRTYLERDIPQLGPRIAAETLRRFWTMLANDQGGLLNAARLASGLGVSGKTVTGYLDLMVDLLLVRRLEPWLSNAGKRLTRAPKAYVRDSGLVHALLGLPDLDALLGHPVVGPSWEGFVIENLLTVAPDVVQASHYRAAGGAEVDLVLAWPDGRSWVVEIKRSLAPALSRGFHSARADIGAERGFVVYPGTDRYRLAEDVEVVRLVDLCRELAASP